MSLAQFVDDKIIRPHGLRNVGEKRRWRTYRVIFPNDKTLIQEEDAVEGMALSWIIFENTERADILKYSVYPRTKYLFTAWLAPYVGILLTMTFVRVLKINSFWKTDQGSTEKAVKRSSSAGVWSKIKVTGVLHKV